jgi:hypothetical protein
MIGFPKLISVKHTIKPLPKGQSYIVNYPGTKMTRLDQLIQRIEDPIKVSTEDAMDVVKQYWDEAANTVSSYWNDTDTEVAEEIGIPKPTLSQLLDQHGNGTAYANTGGNSGVDSYVTGEDWILVNFTTGAKYLYTHKSTTYENIEQMKKYAAEGRGLNSFIMRISKDGYAGRNIKGNILIRPGMEHYRQQANKRLQLLYAFRNAKMSTVSNEGIFDTIKRLFIAEQKEKTPTKPVEPTYVWDDAAKIEKSPPSQLLETSSNSAIFQINGAYNPNWLAPLDSDIRQYERITKELTAYDRKLAAWHNKWDARFDEFLGDTDRKDEFVAVIKEAIKEQPAPWHTVFRNNYDFLGWGKGHWDGEYGFGNYPMAPAPTVKIPLINEVNTRQVVAMIGKLGKFLLTSYDVSEKLTYVAYDFTDPPFRGYYFESDVSEVLNGFKYHMDAANTSLDHFGVIEDRIELILKALVAYVKSAESNALGNEVYMHNTMNTYQAQLSKAGSDGLDTTARQFMAIGLESMTQADVLSTPLSGTTVTTNSLESLNAPTVPSNEELKAMCAAIGNRCVSVSNEGIWGAVKYLFGGNYDNLPRINAAYDEAVDAVKSTYANPQWVKGRRLNTDKPIKIEYFSGVAADPAKAFEKVKQLNHKAVTDASNYVKEEVEYLSKFTKVLTSGDDAKIKALLDMFEVRKPRDLTVADEADFDDGGTVKGLSQEGILKAAEVFIEAVKYRRTTDALYSQGMYKLMYTDSGKVRYGNGGEVTSKLNGPAKELAIKIGESADNVEKSFFNAFTPAWDNVDGVVRGTLMILEASAK